MYRKIITRTLLRALFQMTFAILILYSSFAVFNSKALTIVIALVLVSYYFIINYRTKNTHKELIMKLLSVGILNEGQQPQLFNANLKAEWEKGYGLLNNIAFTIWSKASNKGIELLLISSVSKGTITVPWKEIQLLHHCHYTFDEKPEALLQLTFFNSDMEVYIPWSEKFDNYVPDSVGIRE